MDSGKVTLVPEPVLESVAAFEVAAPSEPSIQLTEWLNDQPMNDPGLLGAFVYTMRKRNKFAAPPSEFDTAFAAFAAEMPE